MIPTIRDFLSERVSHDRGRSGDSDRCRAGRQKESAVVALMQKGSSVASHTAAHKSPGFPERRKQFHRDEAGGDVCEFRAVAITPVHSIFVTWKLYEMFLLHFQT